MHPKFRTILLIALLSPACACADSIWIASSAGPNALELKNITITGIAEGKLLYQVGGRDSVRDLAVISRIKIDSEAAFSMAEEAFAAGQNDIALTAYQAAAKSTRRPWLKTRIDARLTQLAAKPAAAPQGAIAAPARDVKAKLDAIAAALARKEYQPAMTEIHMNRPLFADAASQAQALFYLAQAEEGLAAPKNDPQSWQDVALAYMRIVAHFPASPLAPQALLKVAHIEKQQLNDPAAARSLYEQIAAQYPNDPAAAAAKEQLR
jgi:TolA-binding protein